MSLARPRRIMVMGPPGSGKSTLARALGTMLDLPVTHLDQLYHAPGWRPRPREQFHDAVDEAADRPGWVIDGNYTSAIATRLAVADLIVLLDLPRHVTLPRLLRRILLSWGRVRADSAPGCPERLDPVFLAYAWRWPSATRPRVLLPLAGETTRLHHLRHSPEVARLIESLSPPARASAS